MCSFSIFFFYAYIIRVLRKGGSNSFHLVLLDCTFTWLWAYEPSEPLTLLRNRRSPRVNSILTPTWKRNSAVVTQSPATPVAFLRRLRKDHYFWPDDFVREGQDSGGGLSLLWGDWVFISLFMLVIHLFEALGIKSVAHARQVRDYWAEFPASLFMGFVCVVFGRFFSLCSTIDMT